MPSIPYRGVRRTVVPRRYVRAEMVHCRVSLLPLATHPVVLGGCIKMFRFGSKIGFLNQSETISVGPRPGENIPLFLIKQKLSH